MLLIRRRRPAGEPDGLAGAAEPGDAGPPILQRFDGTAGAGRICAALLDLGIQVAGVRQAVLDPEASDSDFAELDLDDRFDLVVLGSHLVNAPEAARRSAFLSLGARHLRERGRLIVEHHPIDWAETAADVEPTPGSAIGMVDVCRDPPFVSATSVFDAFGRVVRQPFRARVLSEAELAAELERHGLTVTRRLGPTWLEAAGNVVAARRGVESPD